MKTSSVVMVLFLLIPVPSSVGQVKPVHFKVLQESLPQGEVLGLVRLKPTGSSQTTMGMSTSEASVRYESKPPAEDAAAEVEAPTPISIEYKLSDAVAMPYLLAPFMFQQDIESETESGYEKSTVVMGRYKGMQRGQSGDGYESAELTFVVANRFVVAVTMSGKGDQASLDSAVTKLDLAKLEKLATQ